MPTAASTSCRLNHLIKHLNDEGLCTDCLKEYALNHRSAVCVWAGPTWPKMFCRCCTSDWGLDGIEWHNPGCPYGMCVGLV